VPQTKAASQRLRRTTKMHGPEGFGFESSSLSGALAPTLTNTRPYCPSVRPSPLITPRAESADYESNDELVSELAIW